jgi:uncharacterized protein with ATP-grasp and redox domains
MACVLRQALNTVRVATDDPAQQIEVMRRVAAHVAGASLDQTPAGLSQPVYRIVSEVTGVRDPYARLKAKTNAAALALLPDLEAMVCRAPDPLKAAVHLAVAGNIVDLGIGHPFDLEQDVADLMRQAFAIDAYGEFRRDLRRGASVLYLGDNAGEIVFDRVLVEQLRAAGAEVTFTVKSGPVINDATLADAEVAGLTGIARVIETGSDDIGVAWERVSPDFRQAFAQAEAILAKGHGNFETCCDRPGNLYFLLTAKCDRVAAELGVRRGDTVFQHRRNPGPEGRSC